MINIINLSLSSAKSDMIVIPQSTVGTVSESFKPLMQKLSLTEKVSKEDLGSVIIRPVTASHVKYVAYACSVNDFASTFTTIYRIIKNLHIHCPSEVKSIAMPLLGTGAGGLDPYKVYNVLFAAVNELLPNKEINLHLLDSTALQDYNLMIGDPERRSLRKLVFDYSIDTIRLIPWVETQLKAPEFYFELAKEPCSRYFNHNAGAGFYESLLADFKTSKLVYSKFLYKYGKNSDEYKFLSLCGELVSYIDRSAYNKAVWNRYDDKRTFARSSVNQTRWIENLIAFKAKRQDYKTLPDSIKNAVLYLRQPSANLTMLSTRHRMMLSRELFDGVAGEEFTSAVFDYFRSKDLVCANPENNGTLYSRILYIPDIKELWEVEPQEDMVKVTAQREKMDIDVVEPRIAEIMEMAEAVRQRKLKLLMHSDLYAQEDLLQYETYASIIARLITSKLSEPPFNISIVAPWGKGKTSLMRFIEKKINHNLDNREKEDIKVSYRSLIPWLLAKGRRRFDKPLENPVIWFNAWKFQKSEQVWAGLADEIIRQLASQLEPVNRQKFWLGLNLSRIDISKVKWELALTCIRKVVVPILYLCIGVLLSYILTSGSFTMLLPEFIRDSRAAIIALPIIAGVIAAVRKLNIEISKPPDIDFSKFLSRPKYRSKTGYLHEVEDDLKNALKLAVNKDKPAVIFIDDLDRCSPNVIADVVEAINAFMTGELSNCYFIIGQDPRIVTASLDAAYEKISAKLGKLESEHSTIGRFFLEKFSQLTINLPVLSDNLKRGFVDALLPGIDESAIVTEAEQATLREEYEALQRDILSRTDPLEIFTADKEMLEKEILKFKPELVISLHDEILANAFRSFEVDSNELENIINDIGEYLDSPRTIKRFLNLFLFYHFFRFTIPGRGLLQIEDQVLSRWLIITVRWPLLVQAIQWNTEKGFFEGSDCSERAEKFDDFILKSTDYAHYQQRLLESNESGVTWKCDDDLFEICKGKKFAGIKLAEIVNSGIW